MNTEGSFCFKHCGFQQMTRVVNWFRIRLGGDDDGMERDRIFTRIFLSERDRM